MELGGLWNSDVLIFTAMVATECSNVALNTLFKAASSNGMSSFVFLVYTSAIGALLLLPAPFISHRSTVLPPLSFSILWKIVLLGVIGSVYLVAGYTGIRYSSPTLASAMSNLTPAFTFILAIFFRMEKIHLEKSSGLAKVLGTIVSVTGAFIVTLYKGPPIFTASQPSISVSQPLNESSNSDWALGGALLAVEYSLVPVSYIVQAQIMKEYPNEFTVIFFYSLCVSILTGPAGLIMERNNPSAWKINSRVALFCIILSGLFGTCAYCTIHTWGVRLKGPVYVAMFKPLAIVIAVGMGALFLGDSLYLGSLIGGTLIALGFYTVMWGKAKEEHKAEKDIVDDSESPTSQKVPLLKTHKEEEQV